MMHKFPLSSVAAAGLAPLMLCPEIAHAGEASANLIDQNFRACMLSINPQDVRSVGSAQASHITCMHESVVQNSVRTEILSFAADPGNILQGEKSDRDAAGIVVIRRAAQTTGGAYQSPTDSISAVFRSSLDKTVSYIDTLNASNKWVLARCGKLADCTNQVAASADELSDTDVQTRLDLHAAAKFVTRYLLPLKENSDSGNNNNDSSVAENPSSDVSSSAEQAPIQNNSHPSVPFDITKIFSLANMKACVHDIGQGSSQGLGHSAGLTCDVATTLDKDANKRELTATFEAEGYGYDAGAKKYTNHTVYISVSRAIQLLQFTGTDHDTVYSEQFGNIIYTTNDGADFYYGQSFQGYGSDAPIQDFSTTFKACFNDNVSDGGCTVDPNRPASGSGLSDDEKILRRQILDANNAAFSIFTLPLPR